MGEKKGEPGIPAGLRAGIAGCLRAALQYSPEVPVRCRRRGLRVLLPSCLEQRRAAFQEQEASEQQLHK